MTQGVGLSLHREGIARVRVGRRMPRWWTSGCVGVVLVFGVLVTGGFTYRVAHKPGVYWSQVDVLFLAPNSLQFSNVLTNSSSGLITVAGTIGRMVDPDQATARVVSPSVTLVDQGIRRGYAVTLPNDGGQWADNFDRALLDVQVAGPTLSEVSATTQRLIGAIDTQLTSMQDRANVVPVNRIHTSLSPSQPQIYYVNGRRLRALLVVVGLGLGVTLFVAVAVCRVLMRRSRSAPGA